MRRAITFLAVIAVLVSFCGDLWARPATPYEAELVVTGWLRTDARPLDAVLGRNVLDVETVTGDYGELIYYVVHLDPSGFVIVAADDGIEPIIAFADDGTFEPSPAGPLGAMAANDLTGRIAAAENTIGLLAAVPGGHQAKWRDLIDIGEAPEPAFELMGLGSVRDVRVAPLLTSRWGQMQVCGNPCYNYYTPNNYPAGCVATAMAQVMRYHEYPPSRTGIGRHQFSIVVDGRSQSVYTRGGDGNGGPYRWSLMLDRPGCSATVAQREAIGAFCYDAGIAAEMDYSKEGSGTNMSKAQAAMLNTFTYSNAVVAWDRNENIDIGLKDMVNPNLDAAHPVIFGIIRDEYGHAVVCDGYGYTGATLYHHLNMGWDGYDDAWYNLPDIDSNPYYESVFDILYNVFTSGSGEIISGRVLDPSGNPVAGAAVEAEGEGGPFTAVTDSRGVYALAKVKSSTSYTVRVTAEGYHFAAQTVRTETSRDDSIRSGNKWGIDFTGMDACRYAAAEDFETGDFAKLPWEHSGTCDWTVTSAQKHSGTYGARSGPIGSRESTTLRITQDCTGGDILFYVKVSCESDWDYLTFSIDAVEMDDWSGDDDWEEVSFPVRAGTRVFEWTYSKDGSGSEGEDCAWIDDIVFPIAACPEPSPTPPPGPTPPPPPAPKPGPKLAAYWAENYASHWSDLSITIEMRDYFAAASYEILDADELKTWMNARIADGVKSVVVFCKDLAPDTVVERNSRDCTLRKYLDAGGKIIWHGDIPFYNQGRRGGTETLWGESGQANILGIGNTAWWGSGNRVTITPDGLKWGLTQTWASTRSEHTMDVNIVLASDGLGNAAAWVKHFVYGDRYGGFVRIFDRDDAGRDRPSFQDVQHMAEYGLNVEP